MGRNSFSYSKLLEICRTCLKTTANIPIFSEEMDTTNYSEMVYIVAGVKVKINDGLPQKICHNCLKRINDCLDFRKQCNKSETQLLIMKTQSKTNIYKSETKLENINIEIGSKNQTSNEIENDRIERQDHIAVPSIIPKDNHKYFHNKKKCHETNKYDVVTKLENISTELEQNRIIVITESIGIKIKDTDDDQNYFDNKEKCCKNELSENAKYVSDINEHEDHLEIDTVGCKLCTKIISKQKFHLHMNTKHKHMKRMEEYCKRNQFNHHKLAHKKNKPKEIIESDLTTNNNNSMNESLNKEIHETVTKNNNTLNKNEVLLKLPNSDSENIINEQKNSIKSSIATQNDTCNDKQNCNSINESICSQEVISDDLLNNVIDTEKEKKLNSNLLTDKSLTPEVKNCSNEVQKIENTFADTELEIKVDDTILYYHNSTNSRRVTCKLCQKDLSIRSVNSHIARHHPGADQRRVKCELCDKFVMKSKLIRHKTLMHDSQDFICKYCKCEFDTKEGSAKHVATCNAKRKQRNSDASRELVECEVCHKKMQKGSLKLHNATKHAGLRPVCEHCGKSFGNKFRLHDHYRAKHGYEKFRCSACDFQSASAMAMRNHERRHRGEKPFVCERCGARFHAAYLLAQHAQAHAAHKRFQCDLCPASFKVNNTLHMHRRACHSTCKYACTMCTRTYRTRHYVVKHMRTMHRYTGPVPNLTPVP